jgi:hypothetical protein
MNLFISQKQADRLKGYSIIRTSKFIITLNHGALNKNSIKYYLEDVLQPFITLGIGVGHIFLFPIQLVSMLWSLIPHLHIIKRGESTIAKR